MEDETKVVDNVEESNEEVEESNGDEAKFTQADIDKLITERLSRERKKFEREQKEREDEIVKARQEEEGDFKSLYEDTVNELNNLKHQQAERERLASIQAQLKEHGLSDEQAAKGAKRLNHLSDEDLESELLDYANDFKTATTVDAQAGFGQSKKPKAKIDEEDFTDLVDSVRHLTRTKFK